MSMVANHSSAAATGKSQGKKANSQPPGPASKTSKSSKNASSTNNNEQGSNDSNSSSGGGGIFRPLVVLALPGVNLFRRFSQYKRLPQDPPKDRLEVELERLNNKIDNLLDKLDEVEPEKASNTGEECVVCESNKATMQTFPCAHQVVCRTCFVRTIQTTVAQKKLPLRCVLCRAKILRLKQHHKGSQLHPREKPTSASSSTGATLPLSESEHGPTQHGGVPQSVSNYSITRLSSSSSNHSFASGVSSVSSGSSVSVRSVRSFNFDTFSNFQNVNLVHKNHLTRTTSGTSFSGRRRSRSPSPVGIGVRSRSMDGRMPKITVDRTPSDESLASSCAQMSMTSPGSSSSPRSPISPPWSSASNAAIAARPNNASSGNATGAVGAGGVAFFPGNGNGSAHGSPNSPPGNCNGLNGITNPNASCNPSGVNNANNHLTQLTGQDQNMVQTVVAQPVIQTYQVSERRTSRLCTPLSPIKESRREGSGSSLELRCSPERSMTSSPVTPVDNENTTVATATLIKWDDEEGDLKTVATPVRNQKVTLKNNGGKQKAHPSSRIRCADKILTQLEIHADAAIANNGTANRKMMASLKSDSTTKRNAIIFGDIADRANANNSHMLTRNASLDESLLDNMKPSQQQHQKPRKSVTFKDC